jgi:hypothetical protein
MQENESAINFLSKNGKASCVRRGAKAGLERWLYELSAALDR